MSCATGYGRFGKHPFFKTGSKFWVIKMLGKKSFYKLFNTLLRPFSAFNFSAASTQGLLDQDEDDDQKIQNKINGRKSQFVPRAFSTLTYNPLTNMPYIYAKASSNKYSHNPFLHQSGLQSLATVNSGAFDKMEDNKSFSHSLKLINDPIAMDDFCLDDVQTVFSDYEFEDREDITIEQCSSGASESNFSEDQSIVVQSLDQSNTSTLDVSVY